MPIANIYVHDNLPDQQALERVATQWAEAIDVDMHDVCLTLVPMFAQAGRKYKVMVNLYLPSLWTAPAVKEIQKSLLTLLVEHFHIKPDAIFIATSFVQSGHVVDGGNIIQWQ